MLDDKLIKWLTNPEGPDLDEDGVPTVLTQVFPGIYTFMLLKEKYNRMWLSELANFKRFADEHKVPVHRPNSMNNHGVILDDLGYQQMIQQIINAVLIPLAS